MEKNGGGDESWMGAIKGGSWKGEQLVECCREARWKVAKGVGELKGMGAGVYGLGRTRGRKYS